MTSTTTSLPDKKIKNNQEDEPNKLPDPTTLIKQAFTKQMTSLPHVFLILLSLSVTAAFINSIANFLVVNVFILLNPDFTTRPSCFIRALVNFLSLFPQRFGTFVFFALRMHYTFQGSVFALNKRKLVFWTALGIFAGTCAGIAFVVQGYLSGEFLCSKIPHFQVTVTVNGVIGVCIDGGMMAFFVVKLRKVNEEVHSRRKKNKKRRNADKDVEDVSRIQETTLRVTVLGLVAASTTFLFVSVVAHFIAPYQCYTADILVNTSCVLLSFKVMKPQYQCCCWICIRCRKCCQGNEEDKGDKVVHL